MDLFTPISRDERQRQSVDKWIKSKGKGIIVAPTGFGKTKIAIDGINRILKKYPSLTIQVIVPSTSLVEQWNKRMSEKCLSKNFGVHTINTAVQHNWKCDILILDEIESFASDKRIVIFDRIKSKLVLGLTATLERLDNKQELITNQIPVIDLISREEALQNNWISSYSEYKVYIHTDLSKYKELNKQFYEHFSFFNYNWELVLSLLGPEGFKKRIKLRDTLYTGNDPKIKSETFKNITYHAVSLMRIVKQRKEFVYTHPEKIRLTREIINHRPNSKIITFSATTKIAENIGIGYVYTGKDSKKKSRTTIEEFISLPSGVLNTCKKADAGLDIPGLNIAINLGIDSSKRTSLQRTGRVIRKESGKQVEIFTFIIRGTIEEEWWNYSHPNSDSVITVDEENLMHVLRGEPYEQYNRKPMKMIFRF